MIDFANDILFTFEVTERYFKNQGNKKEFLFFIIAILFVALPFFINIFYLFCLKTINTKRLNDNAHFKDYMYLNFPIFILLVVVSSNLHASLHSSLFSFVVNINILD